MGDEDEDVSEVAMAIIDRGADLNIQDGVSGVDIIIGNTWCCYPSLFSKTLLLIPTSRSTYFAVLIFPYDLFLSLILG